MSDKFWQAATLVAVILSVAAVIVGALLVGGLHTAGVALLWLGVIGLLSLALCWAFWTGIV